jgi:signal transduction histidine kinase
MRKLWVRLTGAFLLVALVAVLVISLAIERVVGASFRGYLGRENALLASDALVGLLEEHYAQQGSWEDADDLLPGPRSQGAGKGSQGKGRGAGDSGGTQYTLVNAGHIVVAATDPARVGEHVSTDSLADAAPLRQDGEPVGWLLVKTPGQSKLNSTQVQFLNEVRRSLIGVALLAGGLALVVGTGFSRVLARPLRQLTDAAQAVAEGKLGQSVPVHRGSAAEITTLAESFNGMSRALAEGEALRQRMTADIAHELRTPISVMRGQLQAMLDGVTPTDAEHVAVVFDQTLHLSRLVEDLRTLTQAEAGHLPLQMRSLNPPDLIARAGALFSPLAQDAGLTLSTISEDGLPRISGDPDRLHQVLANLLANALRHTAPGGRVEVRAGHGEDGVRFSVTNSGETLSAEQARHVFERFWRADDSRNRDRGGAGLGLAIAREIVRLHGGRIWVEAGSGETRFVFEIPRDG